MEPWQLGVVQAQAAVSRGELSVVELVSSLLARIGRLNPANRVWVTVDEEDALAQARAHDALPRPSRPRLHGVPIGLKDVIHAAGLPTTASSKSLVDVVADEDAAVVAQLRQAGALVLGKLETCEFACADPSVTLNPWSPARTPGGSSSGSAVAVALGLVPASLGTQTGGSTLRPAAYNGVVGFKPTYGALSNDGVIPLAWSLDQVGLFARSVADVETLLDPLVPADLRAAGRYEARRPRIGLVGSALFDSASEESAAHLAAVARTLADAGAEICKVDLDGALEPYGALSSTIMAVEAATYHRERYAELGHLYGPRIADIVQRGLEIKAPEYVAAQRARIHLGAALDSRVQATGLDALLMLTAPEPAPADLTTTGDPSYLVPWTTAGLPTISIPTALSADGLPLGVQMISPRGRDRQLLATARWAETVVAFTAHPPAWT